MEKKKIYIETYGCQMNFSDSEIVASILSEEGYLNTRELSEADVVFLNTCSIRDNAEQKILRRLEALRSVKKKKPGMIVGLLGCMAERLREGLLEREKVLDLIAGPDAYRDLPRLLTEVESGQKAINTILLEEETYANVTPVRYDSNGVSAFISIMRGCENHCAYCVVPAVRGKERSRNVDSILAEAKDLFENGYREITLLGQNVNSYEWKDVSGNVNFACLIEKVAEISPFLRVRFATSHPKDLSDDLLHAMASHPNICKAIHLPVQSGSDAILDKMNRKYTAADYRERVEKIRKILPGCTLSTDIISGFCDETEADHQDTLAMMEWAGFDAAFMFRYSERPDTLAATAYHDNVPDDVKESRLNEIIALQNRLSLQSNRADIGKIFEVLIEGDSKRSADHFSGRTSGNKVVVFPKNGARIGEYVPVHIRKATSATMIGEAV